MGRFICKQPNGLYCVFSTTVDCPVAWNMTREEYIQMKMEEAKEDAIYTLEHNLFPFENTKASFAPNNMTRKEFNQFMRESKQPVNLKEE